MLGVRGHGHDTDDSGHGGEKVVILLVIGWAAGVASMMVFTALVIENDRRYMKRDDQ